jgi:multisubunit Na+/H+ antiporter MnhG subunit
VVTWRDYLERFGAQTVTSTRGTLSAIFAFFFAVLSTVYALSYVLLTCAAALVVALGLALSGLRRLRLTNATRKAAKSFKEKAELAQQQNK